MVRVGSNRVAIYRLIFTATVTKLYPLAVADNTNNIPEQEDYPFLFFIILLFAYNMLCFNAFSLDIYFFALDFVCLLLLEIDGVIELNIRIYTIIR